LPLISLVFDQIGSLRAVETIITRHTEGFTDCLVLTQPGLCSDCALFGDHSGMFELT